MTICNSCKVSWKEGHGIVDDFHWRWIDNGTWKIRWRGYEIPGGYHSINYVVEKIFKDEEHDLVSRTFHSVADRDNYIDIEKRKLEDIK